MKMVGHDHAPPTPSINLTITQGDAARVMEASRALKESLVQIQKEEGSSSSNNAGNTKKTTSNSTASIKAEDCPSSSAKTENATKKAGATSTPPQNDNLRLHAQLLRAAGVCDHTMIKSFLGKMTASGLEKHEAEAGIVLFHEMDKSSKLKLVFDVLLGDSTLTNTNAKPGLNRKGAKSLFKSVLTALSCCIQKEDQNDKLNDDSKDINSNRKRGRDQLPLDPPTKKMKLDDATPSSPLNSTSFDSSLPTLKSEDDGDLCPNAVPLSSSVCQDIENVSTHATDRFIDFVARKKAATNFEAFGEWYNSGGCTIVPWLELLHLSKWKTAASEMAFSSSVPATNASKFHHAEDPTVLPPAPVQGVEHPILQQSPANFLNEDYNTRTVVSFDFSGSMLAGGGAKPLRICISEESLLVVRNLVHRTNLVHRSAPDICRQVLRVSTKRTLNGGRLLVSIRRDDFRRYAIPKLMEAPLSHSEVEIFSGFFEDFFRCFEGMDPSLKPDEVNAKELAVGLCFLCQGKKSAKLATGYELLDDVRCGRLSQSDLMRYLRSYLTMLVGMTFLRDPHKDRTGRNHSIPFERRRDMRIAVENGAKWTLGHFLDHVSKRYPGSRSKDAYPFECFAEWYSSGGYNVAPWLELLDLNKLVSLIEPTSRAQRHQPYSATSSHRSHQAPPSSSRECRSSHRRHHHNRSSAPNAQILFTFPLANQRSLVVLRDDATYVRGVVEQLGLLSLAPEDIWSSLSNEVRKRPQFSQGRSRKKNLDADKSMIMNQQIFLDCMESAFKLAGRRGPAASGFRQSSIRELLSNFFHSFDLNQVNSVMINELMGGLTLLCGGKKSTKLAFAFGIFDSHVEPQPKGRKGRARIQQRVHSLNGKDLFLFLRSFLIVMFSCCCQSLDMTDDQVDRYIADTAHMVAENVMQYQWHHRKKDRVDFDEFGEWYNEGGFEVAPWLELLDLKKWVLVDNFDALESHSAPAHSAPLRPSVRSPQRHSQPQSHQHRHHSKPQPPPPPPPPPAEVSHKQPQVEAEEDPDCPPPPPEDELDPNFLNDVDNDLMQMGSMDEMDMILLQDKENDILHDNKINKELSYSPDRKEQPLQKQQTANQQNRRSNSLKFHLVTDDDHGGFMLSISQKRIRHLREILVESGLYKIDAEEACNVILSRATKTSRPSTIAKCDFDSAMQDLIFKNNKVSGATQRVLSDILSCVFAAFDVKQTGKPNAMEVACGFTVLCKGKKSDKLEFAFDVLDKHKNGKLSKQDMSNYLRSFLTVLLSIACTPSLETDSEEDSVTTMKNGAAYDRSTLSVIRCVESGSRWAVSEAFKTGLLGRNTNGGANRDSMISFDDFAAWYTNVGYSSIPWLELLDLNKWVVTES